MKYILFIAVGSTALLLSYYAMIAIFDMWLYLADFIR